MNVLIYFLEVSEYVERKYRVKPAIAMLDDRTIQISYNLGRFLPTIKVNLHVNVVAEESILLTYQCSTVVSKLIEGIIHFIQEKIPKEQVEISTDTQSIFVHLRAIKKLENMLEYVSLSDISFDVEKIKISITIQ